MRIRLGVSIGLGLLLPMLAHSAELSLSGNASIEYDDNIFRVSEQSTSSKEDDVIFRLTPGIELSEDRDRFGYSFKYRVPFYKGATTGDISDVDHFGDIELNYNITDRTEFYGTSRIRAIHAADTLPVEVDVDNPLSPEVNTSRERVLRMDEGLGVRHAFSPRLSANFRFDHSLFNTTVEDRAENQSIGTTASLSYVLGRNDRIGTGFSWRGTKFDDLDTQQGSTNSSYRLFLQWVHQFNEKTTFSISTGPVLFDNQQDDSPTVLANQALVLPFQVLSPSGLAFFNRDRPANMQLPPGTAVFSAFDPTGGGSCSNTVTPLNPTLETCTSVVIDPNSPGAANLYTAAGALNTTPVNLSATDAKGAKDLKWSVFSAVSLSHRWTPTLSSTVSYNRSESTSSGLGGTTILDAVALSSLWRPAERWTVSVRGDWTLRESVSPARVTFSGVEGSGLFGGTLNGQIVEIAQLTGDGVSGKVNQAIDTQRFGVSARLEYQLTRNTDLSAHYLYNQQSSESGSRGVSTDFENHIAIFGVKYSFEPIEVW